MVVNFLKYSRGIEKLLLLDRVWELICQFQPLKKHFLKRKNVYSFMLLWNPLKSIPIAVIIVDRKISENWKPCKLLSHKGIVKQENFSIQAVGTRPHIIAVCSFQVYGFGFGVFWFKVLGASLKNVRKLVLKHYLVGSIKYVSENFEVFGLYLRQFKQWRDSAFIVTQFWKNMSVRSLWCFSAYSSWDVGVN